MENLQCYCNYQDNFHLLGTILSDKAKELNIIDFQTFLKKRDEILYPPKNPNLPIPNLNNPLQKAIYANAYQKEKIAYNYNLKIYQNYLNFQKLLKQYEPTKSGYAQFLTENYKNISPFLERKTKIPLKEECRQFHTYITGNTGSGKSETIKSIIWHYLTRNQKTGLVLITPSGDIAEEVAKFWVNLDNDRLIYLEPKLDGFYPCLNPFDIPNKENMDEEEIEKYTNNFIAVFNEILQSEFTNNETSGIMELMLKRTISVIIRMPNSSIYDLIDFLQPFETKKGIPEKIQKYLDFANQNIKNPLTLNYLNGEFKNSLNQTKSAIYNRLVYVFGDLAIQKVMKGKATINIEKAINEKKLIVFNFNKENFSTNHRIIGLFIIISLKIIALNRKSQSNRIPCHVFVDECQNYITPSLQESLEELRKYGLFLTLAQQQAGAHMNEGLLKSILANVGIKITGNNGTDTLKIIARETGDSLENLQKNLTNYRFSLWQRTQTGDIQEPPVIVSMPTNTLKHKQSMKDFQWEALKKAQIEKFYVLFQRETETRTNTQNQEIIDGFNNYY